MEYNHNAHYVYRCQYHIVFCPKYRRKILVDGVDDAFKRIVQRYCEEKQVTLLEMEVMPDHVHLLLDCPPGMAPLDAVKGIKQSTAVQLRKAFPSLKARMPCLWTRSAFIATVGGAPLEVVKQYIANQKKADQHRRR